MTIKEKFKKKGAQLSQKLSTIFSSEKLEQLAIESGFVQRITSQLKGPEFVELMATEILEEPDVSYEGLCDRLSELNPSIQMSPQALEQRVNSDGAVAFLETVLEQTLKANLKTIVDTVPVELLSFFPRVFLEDSTQISLFEALSTPFKGSGGCASKAAVKIDFICEIHQQSLYKHSITSGVTPDQSLTNTILEDLQPSDLLLRDLGYFVLPTFAKIDQKGAYYASRLHPNIDVYLHEDDEQPLDLTGYINQHYANLNTIDLTVYIGQQERLPCRLIAYRLPDEVVNERRRKAHQNAKRKKRTLSKTYCKWLEFAFYITNVTEDIWSANIVGTIYRIRWQIELIFKHWKSLLRIHILKGTREERIRCLIYGRLIAIILINMICRFAHGYVLLEYQKEMSTHKVIKWLLRKERLTNAIFKNLFNEIFLSLISNTLRLCKQKRKRKTTRELLESKISYLDSFVNNKFLTNAS